MHRRIYQSIRSRNAEAARQAMHSHLLQASTYQSQEPTDPGAPAAGSSAASSSRRARSRRRQVSL
jgi:hypothetical protein